MIPTLSKLGHGNLSQDQPQISNAKWVKTQGSALCAFIQVQVAIMLGANLL